MEPYTAWSDTHLANYSFIFPAFIFFSHCDGCGQESAKQNKPLSETRLLSELCILISWMPKEVPTQTEQTKGQELFMSAKLV